MVTNTLRKKQSRKSLDVYKKRFNFYNPYHIIVDGTFAHKSITERFSIQETLAKLFGDTIKLFTTPCVLNELNKMGDNYKGALLLSRKLEPRKCGHLNKLLPARECIKSLVGDANKNKLFVASQDMAGLIKPLSKIPATPILTHENGVVYLHKVTRCTKHLIEKTLLNNVYAHKKKTATKPRTNGDKKKLKKKPCDDNKKVGVVNE